MAAFPIPFLDTPNASVAGLSDGGILWVLDLTVPDPTLILPLLVGGLHLANVEMNTSLVQSPTARQRAFKLLFQSLAVISVPIATQIPAFPIVSKSSGLSMRQRLIRNLHSSLARFSNKTAGTGGSSSGGTGQGGAPLTNVG
ncbi:Cytochrome c oxidase assembly protein cox18, mitochondrial, partial [Blyttiomyces sp. JEL0837]